MAVDPGPLNLLPRACYKPTIVMFHLCFIYLLLTKIIWHHLVTKLTSWSGIYRSIMWFWASPHCLILNAISINVFVQRYSNWMTHINKIKRFWINTYFIMDQFDLEVQPSPCHYLYQSLKVIISTYCHNCNNREQYFLLEEFFPKNPPSLML